MIAIAILIYVYGLIKAWVKSKWKTDIIKPLPMPPENKEAVKRGGFESDRRPFRGGPVTTATDGGDPTRPTTVGDVERAKWRGGGSGPGDPQLIKESDHDHAADDELSNEFDPKKRRPKVPPKKVNPPIKKIFLENNVNDPTPSTADQEDPFKKENTRAPRR